MIRRERTRYQQLFTQESETLHKQNQLATRTKPGGGCLGVPPRPLCRLLGCEAFQRCPQLAVAQRRKRMELLRAQSRLPPQGARASGHKRGVDGADRVRHKVGHASMLAAPLLARQDACALRCSSTTWCAHVGHDHERQAGPDAAVAEAHARPVVERCLGGGVVVWEANARGRACAVRETHRPKSARTHTLPTSYCTTPHAPGQ